MDAIRYIVDTLLWLLTLAFVLRLLFQWVRANFRDPMADAIVRVTYWLILPLRRLLPPIGKVDTATVVAVIAVASATDGADVARGVALVIAYCLGLGIPFLLLAFGSARAVSGFGWLRRHTRAIQIFGGVLLILVGAALVTGLWNDFVSWVRDAFVSDVTLPI